MEFLLWRNSIGGIFGAVRCGFDPDMAQWIKDVVLLQLQHMLQLQLGSLSGLGTPYAKRQEKKKKKKKKPPDIYLCIFISIDRYLSIHLHTYRQISIDIHRERERDHALTLLKSSNRFLFKLEHKVPQDLAPSTTLTSFSTRLLAILFRLMIP